MRARGLLDARGAALDGLAQRLGADLDGREAELRAQEAQLQVCPAATHSTRTHAARQPHLSYEAHSATYNPYNR